MNQAKLRKTRAALDALRRKGGVGARELQELATALGRTKFTGRGKEPTWINERFRQLRPISIPDHGNRDLKPGTKSNILTQLEEDLDAWSEEMKPDGDDDE